MILNKIIYDIREKLKLNTDDIDITDEYIYHLIEVKRSFLIKQRFSKFTRNIPEEIRQLICVDLEVVDSISDAPCFGDILKSKDRIPAMLEIGGRSALLAVRFEDMLFPHINIVSTERLPFVGYNKWLKKQIYVALDADNYLYFKSDNPLHFNLKQVKVVGVFADTEGASKLNCTATEECDIFKEEYLIEDYLLTDLINMVVKELAPTLNIPNDKVNNSDESDRQ